MNLDTQQLNLIPINSEALQLVPESVARENCVLAASIKNGILHLIFPSIPAMQLCVLEEKIRFILGHGFTYDTADQTSLKRLVDLHYTAAYSTVQNCVRAFHDRCPKNWVDLKPSDDPIVRWCSTCERTVTFCRTEIDLARLKQNGERVAYYDSKTYAETLGLLDTPEET